MSYKRGFIFSFLFYLMAGLAYFMGQPFYDTWFAGGDVDLIHILGMPLWASLATVIGLMAVHAWVKKNR